MKIVIFQNAIRTQRSTWKSRNFTFDCRKQFIASKIGQSRCRFATFTSWKFTLMRPNFKLRERGLKLLNFLEPLQWFSDNFLKIALGDIDRDHRPKDVKTVISEMEEKHCKFVELFVFFSSSSHLKIIIKQVFLQLVSYWRSENVKMLLVDVHIWKLSL